MDEIMWKLGWTREVHTILGKKEVRYHKDGFEIPEKYAKEINETR